MSKICSECNCELGDDLQALEEADKNFDDEDWQALEEADKKFTKKKIKGRTEF